MLMGQQAKTWPDFTRSKSKTRRPRLPFSASMMTQVSKRNVAVSTPCYFLEALVVFLAQLLDPLGRSLLEFGMVLVFPGQSPRWRLHRLMSQPSRCAAHVYSYRDRKSTRLTPVTL